MNSWIELSYLVAASLFIVGLKNLSSPRTAPRGNQLAALGMFVAVVATLLQQKLDPAWILAGVVIGSALGIYAGQKVQMTSMPQLVALFNGLGGAASALVAWSEISHAWHTQTELGIDTTIPIALSTLIGALTFTGSMVAFGKLQELISGRAIVYPLQKTINSVLALAAIVSVIFLVSNPDSSPWFISILILASILGVLSVIPIGGADMPVVISLLNSYSGLAACATGFVLKNNALIISGSLVGASGVILTQIMCKAMNRSLANVLFSAFGATSSAAAPGAASAAGPPAGGNVKSGSPEEAAMLLDAANLVIIVPGYGMAVAQAQHVVRDMTSLLQKNGTKVKYAIHPVAGRMPGHMNVLLAEADVPYDELFDMDQINPEFSRADIALVIGANDVTNPAARNDTSSPIYGMPILDVDKAATIMVLKRSMNPGFAGVDNQLYTRDNTMMVFGDAKDTITKMAQALKEL